MQKTKHVMASRSTLLPKNRKDRGTWLLALNFKFKFKRLFGNSEYLHRKHVTTINNIVPCPISLEKKTSVRATPHILRFAQINQYTTWEETLILNLNYKQIKCGKNSEKKNNTKQICWYAMK